MTGGHLMILNEYAIKKHIEQKGTFEFWSCPIGQKKKKQKSDIILARFLILPCINKELIMSVHSINAKR